MPAPRPRPRDDANSPLLITMNASRTLLAAPRRQAGVNPDGGKELRVGRGHDGGHRAAGRQTGDVDPPRINAVLLHHRVRHAGDQGRFATAALLVVVLEPVPAA